MTVHNRKRPTREKLLDLMRTLEQSEVAEMYGVRTDRVSKWCRMYKLPDQRIANRMLTDAQAREIRSTFARWARELPICRRTINHIAEGRIYKDLLPKKGG